MCHQPDVEDVTITGLADLVAGLADRDPGRRVLVGVAGEPGSGKSTVATLVADRLHRRGRQVALAPMDGFHLANTELARLGLADRKGAIETFDGWGYVNLLRRLRARDEAVVMAPSYERSIEESVGSALAVPQSADIVLTEGNYLLDEETPWSEVIGLLDETWFIAVEPLLRRKRLVARHIRFGKDPEVAHAWVEAVDERNAERVRAGAGRATRRVQVPKLGRRTPGSRS